jgi:hypothetical protein
MLSAICRTYTYENINDMSRKSGLFEGGNQWGWKHNVMGRDKNDQNTLYACMKIE